MERKSDWAASDDSILESGPISPLLPSEPPEDLQNNEENRLQEEAATISLEQKAMPNPDTPDEGLEKDTPTSPKGNTRLYSPKVGISTEESQQASVTVLKDYENNMLLLQQKQLKAQMRICSQLRGIRKSINEIPKALDRVTAPVSGLYRSMNNVAQGCHNMSIRCLGLNCEMVRANNCISQSLERLTEAFEVMRSVVPQAEGATDITSTHTVPQDPPLDPPSEPPSEPPEGETDL
ncbi:uncharacterized protein [Ambystoma mexicanum]|uniref:uncharacterized protein n=1 Tax=Ambystoma mexicanum TaxID=8296 RepID=UPI0037E73C9B